MLNDRTDGKWSQRILEMIVWLRMAQLEANEHLKQGMVKVPVHLALGHEAVAAAVDQIMCPQDSLFLTHRNIHFNLARQRNLKVVLDEYLLKPEGIAGGRLGSMNLFNPGKDIVYTSSILGNNLPVGAGYALGSKIKDSSGVAIIATGDGAIEEGSFYESLVLLKSQRIPAIVLVENNSWSLATKVEDRRCSIDLELLSKSLAINYCCLKGNDPFQYVGILADMRERVANESSPVVIEAHVSTLGYRYVPCDGSPGERMINYHAGPIVHLLGPEYPLIEPTYDDPFFCIQNATSTEELFEITSRVKADLIQMSL